VKWDYVFDYQIVVVVVVVVVVVLLVLVVVVVVLGISVEALRNLFKFSVKWDYEFEYKMDQSKSFAAVAEGIYNEIVARTRVFIYIIFSADTATALCIFSIFYKFVVPTTTTTTTTSSSSSSS